MIKRTLEKIISCDPQLDFLHELIELSKRTINPNTVILFGSRARQDHKTRSDVDLAFDFPEEKLSEWSTFTTTAEEELNTLLMLDLVNIKYAEEHLKKSILAEGIKIYERKNKL